MTVDEYIDGLQPKVRDLVMELRSIVRETVPEATESIKWKMPVYEHKKLLCFIAGHKTYASLGFYRGSQLADPEGLLEGSGKVIRYTHVRELADIQE